MSSERAERDRAVGPRRQLIDRARDVGRIGDADAEHDRIAEPEREAGDKGDLGDVDQGQAPRPIDSESHHAAGEDRRAEIVSDRVAQKSGERRDPVRNVRLADRAQREEIIERQANIAGGNQQGGDHHGLDRRRVDRVGEFSDVDVAQQFKKCEACRRNDNETERDADRFPAQSPSYGASNRSRNLHQASVTFRRRGCIHAAT